MRGGGGVRWGEGRRGGMMGGEDREHRGGEEAEDEGGEMT